MKRLISAILAVLLLLSSSVLFSSCTRKEGTEGTDETKSGETKEDAPMTNTESLPGLTVRAFGAVGDNETDDTEAINAAAAEAKNRSCGIVFPAGKYLLSESVSFSVPVTVEPGAILCPESDKVTLTFAAYLSAGLVRVFSNDGKVVLKANPTSYPEWFGGAADGKTVSTAAIQRAIDCFPSGYGRVEFRAGKYVTDDTITIRADQCHLTLYGAAKQTRENAPGIESKDKNKPVLHLLGATGGNPYDGGLEDILVENMEFTRSEMAGENTDTILVENTIYTTFHNVGFAHSQNGLRAVNANGLRLMTVHATTGGSVKGKEVRGVFIDGSKRGSTGILIDDFIYYAYGSSESTTIGYKDVTKEGALGGSNGDRRIKNFECSGATDYGIYVENAGDFACDISIMEFSMDGIKKAGIFYKGPRSYTWQQINLTNLYLRLDNGAGEAAGVRVNSFGFTHCTNVHVDNAVGANSGIILNGSVGSTVNGCSFSGNDFSKTVSLVSCQECTVNGNTGDKAGTLTLSSCSDCVVSGNAMPKTTLKVMNGKNVLTGTNIFAE